MSTPVTPDLSVSSAERQRFNQAVSNTGLDPDQAWSRQIEVSASGNIPAEYVTTLTVQTAEELNKLVGMPDNVFEDSENGTTRSTVTAAALQEPKTGLLEATELLVADYGREELILLKRSFEAHAFGNPATATANLSLANALLFPVTVDVIAAQSLTLAPGATLTLSGDYVFVYLGVLNIGAGAQIASTANTMINTQVAFSAND